MQTESVMDVMVDDPVDAVMDVMVDDPVDAVK
jgi:hypothetical protein